MLTFMSGKNDRDNRHYNTRSILLHSTDIVHFSREQGSELDSRAYEAVKGSLSTKIEAVVKTLIRIQVNKCRRNVILHLANSICI